MSSPAPYLDGERLQELLTPAAALRAVQSFFSAHPREAVAAPPRIHLPVPGGSTIGLYMPAAAGGYIGLKVVHLMPDRFPAVEAEVFLYRADTGKLLFWGDGKPMTGLRTAAVSTAASLKLMGQCRALLVFGAGVQAAAHIAAFADAYPELEQVWVAARSPGSFRRLTRLLSASPASLRPLSIQPAPDRAEALGRVDCILAATPAPEPLFDWSELPGKCHVVGIGSATAEMNELPPEVFLEGEVWVDTRNALQEAGDFHAATEKGWREEALAGDLFDLLSGDPRPPDTGEHSRTVFKSVGHAAQDLAILIHLWEAMNQAEN